MLIKNKQDWERVRGQEVVPISLFWQYWQETKPSSFPDLTQKQFEEMWAAFMYGAQNVPIPSFVTPGAANGVNFSTAIDKVYDYFNQKYK